MREFAALLSVMGLLFVWSIPDTIALRHLLMLLALVLLAALSPGRRMLAALRANRAPIILIALLTAWLVAQAIFVSAETRWALGELKGQWLMAALALLIGAALAATAERGRMPSTGAITTMLMGVLFAQASLAVGHSVAWWFFHGELLRQVVPLTGGKLEMSYLVNILLAALTVELLYRAAGYRGLLRIPGLSVVVALLVALASAYLAGARNGVLGALFLSLSAMVLFLIDRHRRKGLKAALAVGILMGCLIVAFVSASIRADQRWQTFAESARIGWDIDANNAWIDTGSYPFPKLADGREVETSAYIRVAFIHASLRLIGENPLGVGYGRNAFGHALRQIQPANVGHAHSGFLDLGIAGGIPAMVLWVAFIASLAVAGWRRHFRHNDAHGLLLLFLAGGYMGRMLLDSVNRDHMLQIFMFFVGYLLTVSAVRPGHSQADGSRHTPPPP